MNILDLLPDYERAQHARGRSPRGILRYRDQIRAFARHTSNPDIAAITTETIEHYQEELAQHCTTGTVGNALTAIRSFCRWAVKRGLRSDDPTLAIEWPRKPRTAPRALRREQLQTLCRTLDQVPDSLTDHQRWIWLRNQRAVYLMLYAGLRISEAAALLWRDVDMHARVLTVRDGKGGKDRSLPIHAKLLESLYTCQDRSPNLAVAGREDGRPMGSKSMAHIFERWIASIGVECSAHQLRHSFATEMMRAGADIRSIQEALGHERLETTQRYLIVDAERIRAAVDLLPSSWQ